MVTTPFDGGSARSQRTRLMILDAAVELFRRYGFRKTSMAALAAGAQVAKPTIYAHFDDKEALFVAVCRHLLEEVLARAEAAVAEPTIHQRLTAILAAKFTYLWEVVHASPHALELLAARTDEARAVVQEMDAAYEALLLREIRRAMRTGTIEPRRLGLDAPGLVRVLMQGAYGARYGACDATTHRAHVARFAAAIVRGMCPTP